jgi:hypothetical protein
MPERSHADDVIQISLFDETVAEVLEGQVRYVMRRNPERPVCPA